jgi:hypothetical protein
MQRESQGDHAASATNSPAATPTPHAQLHTDGTGSPATTPPRALKHPPRSPSRLQHATTSSATTHYPPTPPPHPHPQHHQSTHSAQRSPHTSAHHHPHPQPAGSSTQANTKPLHPYCISSSLAPHKTMNRKNEPASDKQGQGILNKFTPLSSLCLGSACLGNWLAWRAGATRVGSVAGNVDRATRILRAASGT